MYFTMHESKPLYCQYMWINQNVAEHKEEWDAFKSLSLINMLLFCEYISRSQYKHIFVTSTKHGIFSSNTVLRTCPYIFSGTSPNAANEQTVLKQAIRKYLTLVLHLHFTAVLCLTRARLWMDITFFVGVSFLFCFNTRSGSLKCKV